jgi:hypothetical protein
VKKLLVSASVAALLATTPTHAQVSQTVLVVGSTPIVGTCTNNYNLYNNNGVLGCQANGSGGGGVSSVSFTGGLISVATPTTTPALTVAGTNGGIPYFSSTSTWASSALLTANALVVGGGVGAAPSTVTTNATVLTALGATPAGSGAIVLATSPALVTPALGAATATSEAIGGATLGSNALAVTGLVNFASVGSAAAPSVSIGNQTTGFYSVSTTGLGLAVNGVKVFDYGISIGGFLTLTAGGLLPSGANLDNIGTNGFPFSAMFADRYVAGGPVPSSSVFAGGTCAGGSLAGGSTAGTATLTGICAATNTWTLTLPSVTTGYACISNDRTTPAAILQETSTSTTTAVFTFSGTTGATDVLQYHCIGY